VLVTALDEEELHMIRRRRPLLRAAAVGGGAYMAGKSRARNQAEREAYDADQDARISDLEAQQAQQAQGNPQQPPPQQPPPQGGGSSMLDQLNELTAMHNSGTLTDEEFTAAKAKLLS
jgi:Short C-terminal domain